MLKQVAHHSLVVHSHDMQKVEDLHVIVLHCVMQYFNVQNDRGI
jgi:hypothetical protein